MFYCRIEKLAKKGYFHEYFFTCDSFTQIVDRSINDGLFSIQLNDF